MYRNYTSTDVGRDTRLRKEKTTGINRWLFGLMILFGMLTGFNASAQVTVTNPGNVGPTPLSGTYGSLALAITDLNAKTSITGPVTITLDAGNPQTCPSGGYSISALLTGASSVNQVTIAGSGNTITAPAPAGTAGNLNDAIFKFVGSDFMTLSGFVMNENAANTVTTAASNTMVEWGVALLYASTTNGAQNITIQNNTITLNRTYQNTFGIYSNSTHALGTIATSATATTTAGANNNLRIYGNTISNVNIGIAIVGPTGVADANTGIEIGGTGLGNSITNFGTTGTFSGYVNLSGTVNGILIRNSNGYVIANNTITSSVGGTTTATLNGIQQQASTNTPTATFTNAITGNNISLQSGLASGVMVGITVPSGSASTTSTLNINSNNFNTFGHTVSGTGAVTFITNGSTHLNTNINSNTFTNISVNTTGSVTFISNNVSHPAAAVTNANNNSIVTAFAKTGAGGTITFYNSNSSTPVSGFETNSGNNFSNITLTGATGIAGWITGDGSTTSPYGPSKTVTNNTFSNITGGSSAITILAPAYSNSGSTTNNVSGNIISNITGTAGITAINCAQGSQNFFNNSISGLSTTGASTVIGITLTGGATQNLYNNTISNLQSNNASGAVNGIAVSAGTTTNIYNNRIGDLRTPSANAANPLIGINITGGTTVNAYYNTVYLNGTSSGALFGSSALSASSTPSLTLNNNIFVNTSTPTGAGLSAAYRRSSTTLTTYVSTSNRNDFFAPTIFTDGTGPNTFSTLASYKSFVSARDANSISENPPFLSTVSGNANFLKVSTVIPTALEGAGAAIAGITLDFEGDTRNGTTPDIGADEFTGTTLSGCAGTPANSTINGVAAVCSGTGTNLSLSTLYTDTGITYAWFSGTTPGGPYPTALGTSATQATGNLTANTYYIATITCGNSGLSFTTAEKAVTINALPTVGVSPTSGTFCSPGGTPITLTATGASTYAWAGTGTPGLSAASGNPVTASPATTTVITVTGTDGNGCTNTAISSITVSPNVTITSATATPSTICTGSNSQLLAVATNGASYITSAIGSPALETPGADPVTTLAGAAGFPYNTNGTLGDDSYTTAIAVPFTFSFFGTTVSNLWVSSNGYLTFSDPVSIGASAQRSPQTLPSSTNPNNVIAAFWHDMDIRTLGNVKYYTIGSAPNRKFVIEFNGVQTFNAATSLHSGQIVLNETSNSVQVYVSGSASATKTLGLENAGGTVASIPAGRNNASWTVAALEGWNFAPPTFTYAWTPSTFLTDSTIANPVATAVTSTTVYNVTASSGGCTSAPSTVTVTVDALVGAAATATSPKCAGSNFSVTANRTGGGAPYNYSWTDGVTATVYPNAATVTANLPAGTYNFDATITDACGGTVHSTLTVVVNALPTISVTPTPANARICGTGTVSMTASGASTYVWTPTTALTPSNGLSATEVSAATSTTIYSVVGTDANGCVSAAATQTVTVGPAVTMGTVAATPSTICSGGTSVLSASATTNPALNYGVTSITPAQETPSGTPTVLASAGVFTPTPSGTAATPTDDGYWDGIALPFNFTFYGVSYSTIRISTNGNVQFGAVSGTAGNPGAASWTPQTIPTAGGFLDNFIGGPMMDQDLRTATGGTLRYFTNGVSPNQKFVISWEAATVFSSTDKNTSQIILNENGTIDVLLLGGGLVATTAKAIGMENVGGTMGAFAPGRNTGTWTTAADEAWRFTAQSLNYSWTGTGGFTSSLQNPTTPVLTADASYSVTATEPVSGCFATGGTSVTVSPNYTITATAGANGSVTPSGATTLCSGGSQAYTIAANAGYHIVDVLVNGVSQGVITSYNFINVTSNQTISATFAQDCVNVALTSASATNSVVCVGSTTTLTYTGLSGTGASVTWTQNANGTGTTYGTGTPSNPVGPGTYYAYATGNCGAPVSLQVVVGSQAGPNAGTDGAYTICSGTNITLAQLQAAITGEDAGGSWSPALGGAGTYTYTVNATSPCTTPDTSVVVVSAVSCQSTQLSNCGNTPVLTSVNTRIFAGSTVTQATLYRFRVAVSTAPSTYFYAETTYPSFRLTDVVGLTPTYGTTYNVDIQNEFLISGNTVTSAYGTMCTVTTQAVTAVTVPTNQCGQTLAVINSKIYVNGVTGATSYSYRIAKQSAPTTYAYIDTPYSNFRLTNPQTSGNVAIEHNTVYLVAVSVTTANGSSNYNGECQITTPAGPMAVIQGSQCGDDDTPYQIATKSTKVYADNLVSGATYTFKLEQYVGATLVDTNYATSPINYFNCNMFVGDDALLPNTNYHVYVAVNYYGQGEFDHDCVVRTPAALKHEEMVTGFTAVAYPNPFANNFMIDVKSSSESAVDLKVYDMIGRLIEQKEVRVSDLETTTIGDRYPSGVYNVVVSQENTVQTVRVVKR